MNNMDIATKAIIVGIIIVIVYFLLAQFELLEGLLGSVTKLAKSIIKPIQNLLGNIF